MIFKLDEGLKVILRLSPTPTSYPLQPLSFDLFLQIFDQGQFLLVRLVWASHEMTFSRLNFLWNRALRDYAFDFAWGSKDGNHNFSKLHPLDGLAHLLVDW